MGGNTLAARVSRQWQEKQLTSAPTLLAALNRRLDTEEHAVAKEFLRNATVRLDSLPQATMISGHAAKPVGRDAANLACITSASFNGCSHAAQKLSTSRI